MKIYTCYDRIPQVYSAPWFARNDAEALRAFNTTFNNTPYADDNQLYSIGDFDELTGVINAYEKPVFISNFVKPIEKEIKQDE